MPLAPIEYKPEEFTGFRSWREVRRPEEDYLSTLLRWGGENVGQLLNLADPGMISGMLSIFRVPGKFSLQPLLRETRPEITRTMKTYKLRPGPPRMRPGKITANRIGSLPEEWAHAVATSPAGQRSKVRIWKSLNPFEKELWRETVRRDYGIRDPNMVEKLAMEESFAVQMSEDYWRRWTETPGFQAPSRDLVEAIAEAERELQPAGSFTLKQLLLEKAKEWMGL